MAIKKIPIRMCVGCREGKPKKNLVRVVKGPDGSLSVDLTGRKPGRGAYICHSTVCLSRAQKSKSLERTFACAISSDIYEKLHEEIVQDEEADDGGK